MVLGTVHIFAGLRTSRECPPLSNLRVERSGLRTCAAGSGLYVDSGFLNSSLLCSSLSPLSHLPTTPVTLLSVLLQAPINRHSHTRDPDLLSIPGRSHKSLGHVVYESLGVDSVCASPRQSRQLPQWASPASFLPQITILFREYSAQGAQEHLLRSPQESFSVIYLPLGTPNRSLILGTSFIQGQVLAASGKGLPGKAALETESHHRGIREQPFCPCLAASHLSVIVCKRRARRQRRVGSLTGAHSPQVYEGLWEVVQK